MARRVQVILLGEWWNTKTATCSPRPCPRCAERCGTVILRCPTELPCTVQSGQMHFQTLRGLRARLAASAPLHHASQRSYTARTNRCICAVPFAGRVLHLACRPLHIARCMRLARSVLFAALERVAVPAARFGPHSGGGTFTEHSACHSSHVTFHVWRVASNGHRAMPSLQRATCSAHHVLQRSATAVSPFCANRGPGDVPR